MSHKELHAKNLIASLSAGMAAAFLPQHVLAEIVTVGGEGGDGIVTLYLPEVPYTDLGGILEDNFTLRPAEKSILMLIDWNHIYPQQYLFAAVRSTVTTPGGNEGGFWQFRSNSGLADGGAIFNSDDNWVPGYFSVHGVNHGRLIFGWLQVELNGDGSRATIVNFTYNDAATDTTRFFKPEGGFPLHKPAAPSTLGLAALALGAAGVINRRRRLQGRKNSERPRGSS